MAEPPSQEGDLPQPSTPTTTANMDLCYGQSPDELQTHGTPAGRNAMRLLQARDDYSITSRTAEPEAPYRPEDLYTMLPDPLRSLHGMPMYTTDRQRSGDVEGIHRRTKSVVMVATAENLLPDPTKIPKVNQKGKLARLGRCVFLYPAQDDAVAARLMTSVIINICERLPVQLSRIDDNLKEFITATASRHAGIATHQLAATEVCLPSGDLLARVQTTASVVFRSSLSDEKIDVHTRTIIIPLAWIPVEEAPETPSIFLLPTKPTKYPTNKQNIGFTRELIARAIKTLQWVQSHVHAKVFATTESLDEYVSHLIRISCLGTTPGRSVAKHGGHELFTILHSVKGLGYHVSPSSTVQAACGGSVPAIVLPESRAAVLRVIERLETVFLATGDLQKAWDAACHRGDIETDGSREDDDDTFSANCNCTFAQRPNTVHKCDKCCKSILCDSQYQSSTHGALPRILCVECTPKGDQSLDQAHKVRRKDGNAQLGSLDCKKCLLPADRLFGNPATCAKCTVQQSAEHKCAVCVKDNRNCVWDEEKSSCRRCTQQTRTCRPPESSGIFEVRMDRYPLLSYSVAVRIVPDGSLLECAICSTSTPSLHEIAGEGGMTVGVCKECEVRKGGPACVYCSEGGREPRKCVFKTGATKCGSCQSKQSVCQPLTSQRCGRCNGFSKALHHIDHEGQTMNICTACQVELSTDGICFECSIANVACTFYDNEDPCDRCAQSGLHCRVRQPTDALSSPQDSHNLTRTTRNANRKTPVTKSRAGKRGPISYRALKLFVHDLKIPRMTGNDEAQRRSKDKQYLKERYDTWLSRWASKDGQVPDVYLSKAQAFDHNGDELVNGIAVKSRTAQPFQLSTDALDPNFVDGDIFFNHAPANIFPVSLFLNNTRHFYSPVIIPLMAELCRDRADLHLDDVMRKMDHAYLIAKQFPRNVKSRYSKAVDDPVIALISKQHHTGVADPAACLSVQQPWKLDCHRDFHRFSSPPTGGKPNQGCLFEDLERLKACIADFEKQTGI
jgi:hypothetical protein